MVHKESIPFRFMFIFVENPLYLFFFHKPRLRSSYLHGSVDAEVLQRQLEVRHVGLHLHGDAGDAAEQPGGQEPEQRAEPP